MYTQCFFCLFISLVKNEIKGISWYFLEVGTVIRIMIVDDETLDREGLLTLVKEIEGIETDIMVAESAYKALEIIENFVPDVLLTDVKMPGMDGLTLAEKMSTAVPNIKTVFISGYDDFSYIKRALKSKAYEYILKPVDFEEFHNAMTRILKDIELEKKRQEETLRLKHLSDVGFQAMRKKALLDIVYSHNSPEYIMDLTEKYELSILPSGIYHVLVFEKHLSTFENSPEMEEIITASFTGRESAKETVAVSDSRVVEIISFRPDVPDTGKIVLDYAQQVHNRLTEASESAYTVLVSDPVDSVCMISDAYNQCGFLLNSSSYLLRGMVIHSGMLNQENVNVHTNETINILKEIISSIKTLDLPKGSHMIDKLFKCLEDSNTEDIVFIRSMVISIISSLQIMLLEYGESFENLLGESNSVWDKVFRIETIVDIRQWLKNIFRVVTEYFLNKENESGHQVVSRVISFIQSHFHEEITLKAVADIFHYSPNYLGSLFKKHTGQGFNDYLTRVRFEEAIKLLANPDLKLYEIAYKVGYPNQNYFNRQFKQMFGCTPSEFRAKLM